MGFSITSALMVKVVDFGPSSSIKCVLVEDKSHSVCVYGCVKLGKLDSDYVIKTESVT